MAKSKKKAPSAKSQSKKSQVILGLDTAAVESLIDFLKEKGAYEFEWEKAGTKIAIKLAGAPIHSPVSMSAPSPSMASAESEKASSSGDLKPNQQKILSPFVGTFYRASAPGADPYVTEGQTIRPGDVLCIVEAMKLMNEIDSEVSGKIVKILVDDGQPVEFGEPLFIVEK